MKAAVAVQRKILELIYIIYKTNKAFDKDYMKPSGQKQVEVLNS
jgi:transposase